VRILATIPALAGVITGKAIYEGLFTVEQAVAALRDVKLGSGSGAQ
jgi:phosphoribosylformimino-5-aminoimidazole carboxamide ribonucleotide (ProFAR) isomerase